MVPVCACPQRSWCGSSPGGSSATTSGTQVGGRRAALSLPAGMGSGGGTAGRRSAVPAAVLPVGASPEAARAGAASPAGERKPQRWAGHRWGGQSSLAAPGAAGARQGLVGARIPGIPRLLEP